MRFILLLVFLPFILLIKLEDFIRFLFRASKNILKNTFTSLKKISRKKKKKPFALTFRAKIKYFVIGILFACLFLFPPVMLLIFLQDLPTPAELTLRQIPQTTKIFDRNGVLLTEVYTQQNRTLVTLSDIPQHLQQATLAIEDKNFYKHPGFDISAIVRAFRQTVLNNNTQGGSTITQQLIKSSVLTPEQTISRKLKELVLAFWTEKVYSKDEILEMYFNQIPYGGTAWGVQAASETYFNKSVKDLTLAESAFLAGLTAAPTTYSPYGKNSDLWKRRQTEVLNNMVELNYISAKQREEALIETLHFRKQYAPLHAPHFVEYVKELLISKYGLPAVEKGGLHVTTSIDLKTQEMAEQAVKEEVAKSGYLNLTNGAALVTDPRNGDVLAMVGSHDFNDPNTGNFNVTTSLRQPGSSIKVVTYAAALSKNFTAATTIDDTPVSYPLSNGQVYSPVNYDGGYRGRVTFRFALANSLNIPAVKIINAIGVEEMVAVGKKMGIENWGDARNYGLSITLGAAEVTMLDMAQVNGVFANQGKLTELNPFLKITDVRGNLLEEKKTPNSPEVLNPGVAFIMSDILADNQARTAVFGTNSVLEIKNHHVSVKTGTTDNKRDNWTNGFTNNYVVIVWVGNNDNTPMSQSLASGITGAAPIWHRIMENLLTANPETRFEKPLNVIAKNCNGKDEYFIQGTENSINCASRPMPSIFTPNANIFRNITPTPDKKDKPNR